MIGLLAINQFTGCWSKGCFQSIHSGENLLWTLSTLAVTSCNLEWMRMFLDPFLWAGVASVEDEEDEEELLDEDEEEEATELLSSSFLDGAKGTAFAVALVCMRNGGASLFGFSLLDWNHQTSRIFYETKTPKMHYTEKLCCFGPGFQQLGSFLRFQAWFLHPLKSLLWWATRPKAQRI